MSDQTARPGRPRSTEADEAILASARELLAEGGLDNLTVEGTATRAGVAKTTVYRRYPTKLDLAVAAIADLIHHTPPGDSVADDTAAGLRAFDHYMGVPGSQAAYLAVAAAAATDPETHERFADTVLGPVRERFVQSVTSAQERGEAVPNPPIDFVYDVVMGTLLHRQIIRQQPPSVEFEAQLAKLISFLYQLGD